MSYTGKRNTANDSSQDAAKGETDPSKEAQTFSAANLPTDSTGSALNNRRIISQIPLDFKKLRAAGLDRVIAEAIYKHRTAGNELASLVASQPHRRQLQHQRQQQKQQQHQRQPNYGKAKVPSIETNSHSIASNKISKINPPTITITGPSDTPTESENCSQKVKALLKTTILNKAYPAKREEQRKVKPATTTTTTMTKLTTVTTTTATIELSKTSQQLGSVEIAVARPTPKEPPLVLNLINQLPKRRANCGANIVKQTSLSSDNQATTALAVPATPILKRKVELESAETSPLIVLENKVLAPNEKIDLRALRLDAPTTTTTQGSPETKRIILNTEKLKMSSEKRAELTKEIHSRLLETKPSTSKSESEAKRRTIAIGSATWLKLKQQAKSKQLGKTDSEHISNESDKSEGSVGPKTKLLKPSKPLSAVDFIAQLTSNNNIDTNSMELSPEELMLNASFTSSEINKTDDLAIGKIVKMQDVNILHATVMDVADSKTNVLRISPNDKEMQQNLPVATAQDKESEESVDDLFYEEELTHNSLITISKMMKSLNQTREVNCHSIQQLDEPFKLEQVVEVGTKYAEEIQEIESVSATLGASQLEPDPNQIAPKLMTEPMPDPMPEAAPKPGTALQSMKDTEPEAVFGEVSPKEVTDSKPVAYPNTMAARKSVTDPKPVADPKQVDDLKPVADPKSVDNSKPVVDPKSVDNSKPVADLKQVGKTVLPFTKRVKGKINLVDRSKKLHVNTSKSHISAKTAVAKLQPKSVKKSTSICTDANECEKFESGSSEPQIKMKENAEHVSEMFGTNDEEILNSTSEPTFTENDNRNSKVIEEIETVPNMTAPVSPANTIKKKNCLQSENKEQQLGESSETIEKSQNILPDKRGSVGKTIGKPLALSVNEKPHDNDYDLCDFHGFADRSNDTTPDYDTKPNEVKQDEPAKQADAIIAETTAEVQTRKRGRPKGSKTKKNKPSAEPEPEDIQVEAEPEEAPVTSDAAKEEPGGPSTPVVPTTAIVIPSGKKRGRKPKVKEPPASLEADNQTKNKRKLSVENEDEAKSSDVTPVESSTADTGNMEPPSKKRRVGRPRRVYTSVAEDSSSDIISQPIDFNMRLLLIRKREQLDTDEELRDVASSRTKDANSMQCGLCLQRVKKTMWVEHLHEHYGIGWSADEPEPTLTRSSVLQLMISYLKAKTSLKYFKCRLCDKQLCSALGMVQHLENCAKPQRFDCQYCKHNYAKLSLAQHERTCGARFKNTQTDASVDEQTAENLDGQSGNETVYSNAGRAKRMSTIRAETKLKQIGAHLQSQNTTDRTKESNAGGFLSDSSDYDVRNDKESSDEYESEGVDSNEEGMNSIDEDDDDINGGGFSKKSKAVWKRRMSTGDGESSVQSKPLYGRCRDTEKWVETRWKEFVELNYNTEMLFPEQLPAYQRLPKSQALECLPARNCESINFAFGKHVQKDAWMRLKCFEGYNTKNERITYLGAPIKQLAWVPLPPNIKTQYLLCSLRPKMHGYTRHQKINPEYGRLLLFKCNLNPDESSSMEDQDLWPLDTKLHYGIRIPEGVIHSFALLPSGGYSEDSNRLGLLAIGTSSASIKIYALPLEVNKESEISLITADTVIELQSEMSLVLEINKHPKPPKPPDHCMTICWSQSAGHNFIAAGFASGEVAYWNIDPKVGSHSIVHDDRKLFMPVHWFYYGVRNVKFVELHYDMNGPRWMAVGCATRDITVYDIGNITLPVPICGDSNASRYLSCINWPPIWPTLVFGCSEVYKKNYPRIVAVNPTGVYFTNKTMDYALTTARDIHYSCDQSVQLMVTDNGDIVFLNPRELHMESLMPKLTTSCRTVAMTVVHKLNEEGNMNSSSHSDQEKNSNSCGETNIKTKIGSAEFMREYGLLFKPFRKVSQDKKDNYLSEKRRPSCDLLPLLRINSARYNLNEPARRWVAVGSELGFLRIIYFDRGKYF